MKKFGVFCSLLWLLACTSGTEQKVKTLQEHRAETDATFRDSTTSPLPKEMLATFTGIKYFDENPKYKVQARFTRSTGELPFAFPHTNNKTYVYVKFGEVAFELDGKACKLNVYQSPELMKQAGYEDYLFIPFSDETNGNETYGGGRYLEMRIPKGETVDLDFNYAYAPYCAYNHTFSCPIPPKENTLPLRIEAGEKVYEKR